MALGDPRGDDPDDPGVPALAGQHVRGLRPSSRTCASASKRIRVSVRRRSALAWSSSSAIAGGALGIVGEHQLEPGIGAVQPSGRVDPRARRKPIAARRAPRVDLGHAQQRADPRLARDRERVQPLAHQAAVLVAQRDAVGHGGQGDEVEVLVGARPDRARRRQQRGRELVGDARAHRSGHG
jgi:hypothetical protein